MCRWQTARVTEIWDWSQVGIVPLNSEVQDRPSPAGIGTIMLLEATDESLGNSKTKIPGVHPSSYDYQMFGSRDVFNMLLFMLLKVE